MAKHMVRFYAELPKGNAESAIDNWITNFNEWEEKPSSEKLTEESASLDSSRTDYISGDYRFYQDSGKTSILDDLESKLQSVQGGIWYRIGYHVCDHDEVSRSNCSWENTRENGDIPSDIPNF